MNNRYVVTLVETGIYGNEMVRVLVKNGVELTRLLLRLTEKYHIYSIETIEECQDFKEFLQTLDGNNSPEDLELGNK